uniref:Complex I assembly factor TIMMDC1, mitochondrial n=1 Tax=Pelusios castaneus TaxID=367368 RepID=A0A8C8RBK9_9SAUR
MGTPGAGAEPRSLPAYLGRAEVPDTGWERIRELWHRDENQEYPEETLNIIKATCSAAVIGLIYGGVPAFQYAKKHYIEQSQAEIYQNRMDAVHSAHRAGLRGFIRYGWRWSWRMATFVTIFNVVSTGLSVYRNKTTLSHFVMAGAFTGSVFRMHLGLSRIAGGSILGALFGIPVGGLFMAVQALAGETLEEKGARKRRLLYEQKFAEWNARINVTETQFEEIASDIEEGTMEKDVKKIQELLNLPQNPLPSEDRNHSELLSSDRAL